MTTMRTSTTTHVYVGECATTDPLRCDHASGEFSFRISSGGTTTWLTGTPAEFRAFADRVAQFADELTREGDQFTDQDDFDQSRADHEALL